MVKFEGCATGYTSKHSRRCNFWGGGDYDFVASRKAIEETGEQCLMAGLETFRLMDRFLRTGNSDNLNREAKKRMREDSDVFFKRSSE